MSQPEIKHHNMLLTYHKGLSRFFRRVFPSPMDASPGFDMVKIRNYIQSSQNKHLLSIHNPRFNPNADIFQNCRIVQIIRHPKDFIVSGYHYHRRGSEVWTHEPCPWQFLQHILINMMIYLTEEDIHYFETLPSYHDMLHHLDFETGMMLEIIWRKYRQQFLPLGYYRHPNVNTFRFEEIVPDLPAAVVEICKIYDMNDDETHEALKRAKYETKDPGPHVRNKTAYQYREQFTDKITFFYDQQYGRLAENLGYPA